MQDPRYSTKRRQAACGGCAPGGYLVRVQVQRIGGSESWSRMSGDGTYRKNIFLYDVRESERVHHQKHSLVEEKKQLRKKKNETECGKESDCV